MTTEEKMARTHRLILSFNNTILKYHDHYSSQLDIDYQKIIYFPLWLVEGKIILVQR